MQSLSKFASPHCIRTSFGSLMPLNGIKWKRMLFKRKFKCIEECCDVETVRTLHYLIDSFPVDYKEAQELAFDKMVLILHFIHFNFEDDLPYPFTIYVPEIIYTMFKTRFGIYDQINTFTYAKLLNKHALEVQEADAFACRTHEDGRIPREYACSECTKAIANRGESFHVVQAEGGFAKMPETMQLLSTNFSSFVEKLPDKDTLTHMFESITSSMKEMVKSMADFTEVVKNRSTEFLLQFKMAVISSLVLIVAYSLDVPSSMRKFLKVIIKFIMDFFSIGKVWKYVTGFLSSGDGAAYVVPEGGFDTLYEVTSDSNFAMIGATIFCLLFAAIIGKDPKTKDVKDMCNHLFTYNRGMDASFGLFDKAHWFWQQITDRLFDHQIDAHDGVKTKYEAHAVVTTWTAKLNEILKKDTATMPFDELKETRRKMNELHSEIVKVGEAAKLLDRASQMRFQSLQNLVVQKVNNLNNQPLEGAMRVPMHFMMLAGPSGAGKTTLLKVIQALAAGVLREEYAMKIESDNICSMNLDLDHNDGYARQEIVILNDVFKMKNTETNPNQEANWIMKAVDTSPFMLKMADLMSKGMFFSSKIGISTTNVYNLRNYVIPSMSYPEALMRRIHEMYYVTVKPQYRSYIPPNKKNEYIRLQMHDQHRIDPIRATRKVRESTIREKVGKFIAHENMLDSYTDEEFLRMESDPVDGHINRDVYVFQRMNPSNGRPYGPTMSFSVWAKDYIQQLRNHLANGSRIMEEDDKFFHLSLDEMVGVEGITDKIKSFKESVMNKIMARDTIPRDIPEGENSARLRVVDLISLNYDAYFEVYQSIRAAHERGDIDEMQRFLINVGDIGPLRSWLAQFGEDIMVDALKIHKERMSYYEQCCEFFEVAKEKMKDAFDKVVEFLKGDIVRRVLIGVGSALLVGCVIEGVSRVMRPISDSICKKKMPNAWPIVEQAREKVNNMSFVERIKNFLIGTSITITKDADGKATPLSCHEIQFLMNMYGINVFYENMLEGGSAAVANSSSVPNTAKSTKHHRARVAAECAPMLSKTFERVSENEFLLSESEIPQFVVQAEALVSQLTDITMNHIIPMSQYLMVFECKTGEKSIGNVTFLDREHFIIPQHYLMFINNLKVEEEVTSMTRVFFRRGKTNRELSADPTYGVVELETKLRYIENFARLKTGSNIDEMAKTAFEKDLVMVHVKGDKITGRTVPSIWNKFIFRNDMRRLSEIQQSGNMFVWTCDDNKIIQGIHHELSDIRSYNTTHSNQRIALNAVVDSTKIVNNEKVRVPMYFELRDRYEYTIRSRKGYCGAMLWLSDNQLQRGICGIHVSKSNDESKGCSVPVTYEDLIALKAQLNSTQVVSECSGLTTVPIAPHLYDWPNKCVPGEPYVPVAQLTRDIMPYQPTKSTLTLSKLGQNLEEYADKYERKHFKPLNLERKCELTVLKTVIVRPNNEDISFLNGEVQLNGKPMTKEQYEEFVKGGGKIIDPMMLGLEKANITLHYFDSFMLGRMAPSIKSSIISGAGTQYEGLQSYMSNLYTICAENNSNEISASLFISNLFNISNEGVISYDAFTELQQRFNIECGFSSNVYEVVRAVRSKYKMPTISQFKIRTAIKGIDGMQECKSMNAKSSPGMGGFLRKGDKPYMMRRLPYGKKCWFGEDYKLDETEVDICTNGKVVVTKEQVRENFKELEKDVEHLLEISKTSRPSVVFVATLKDERRPREKVQQIKTRVFQACDMGYNIAFKMLYGPFMSWLQHNRFNNSFCIGMNPYSSEWEVVARRMLKFPGKSCVAGDFSAYDFSQSGQVLCYIRDLWIEMIYEEDPSIDVLQYKNVFDALIDKYVVTRNGVLCYIGQTLPSGCPPTIMVDCFFNMVIFRYIFMLMFGQLLVPEKLKEVLEDGEDIEALKKEFATVDQTSDRGIYIKNCLRVRLEKPPRIPVEEMDEYVVMFFYGDDNILSISPIIQPWFNQRTITKLFNLIGMTYTDEKKTGGMMPDLRELKEITFLKRSFKKIDHVSGRKWIAPLDIDVVNEIPMWRCRNQSISEPEAIKENIRVAVSEMSLHGKTKYDDFVQKMDFMWKEMFHDKITFLPYEEALTNTFNIELD